ncbi:hypothetical protein TKK_0015010 [Trichogramma kaykai]
MSENNTQEDVLEELNAFINDTKGLVDKVIKMRMECQRSQMELLRLFNPVCVKILEISNECIRDNNGPDVGEAKKILVKRYYDKKFGKVRFQPVDN